MRSTREFRCSASGSARSSRSRPRREVTFRESARRALHQATLGCDREAMSSALPPSLKASHDRVQRDCVLAAKSRDAFGRSRRSSRDQRRLFRTAKVAVSRVNSGHFGTFWDADVSAATTRKPMNHAGLLHFSPSEPSSEKRFQIPSGTLPPEGVSAPAEPGIAGDFRAIHDPVMPAACGRPGCVGEAIPR
jgi:hypothetical protein